MLTWLNIFTNKVTYYIIFLLSIVIFLIVFYFNYLGLKTSVKVLTENNANLEEIIKEQTKTIGQVKKDYDILKKIQADQINIQKKVNDNMESLSTKLNRENQGKRSIGEIAEKKPAMTENVINNAVELNFKRFEDLTKNE